MSDIKKLIQRINKFRDERDWRQHHKPKDLAIGISIEASELLEHFLWKTDTEVEEYLKNNKEKVTDEIADILHIVLALSDDIDVDIVEIFERKMVKNEKKYPVGKFKGKKDKYREL